MAVWTPNLIQTFRGRRTTPKFSFDVNGSLITVDYAQIEVDAGFENSEEIILFLDWLDIVLQNMQC